MTGYNPQPSGGVSASITRDDASNTVQTVYKGDYSALLTYANTLALGQSTTLTWRLERTNADLGILTVEQTAQTEDGGGGGGGTDNPKTTLWSVSSSRIDKPIECFCGPGTGSPKLHHLQAWRAEPDADLAAQNKYRRPNGEVARVDGETEPLLTKVREGKTAVMRFYPTLTRTRTYSRLADIGDIYSNLGKIDTPGAPAPFSAVESGLQWLKIKDDTSETAARKWQRIESWIGMASIDSDFYGPNAWPEPLT